MKHLIISAPIVVLVLSFLANDAFARKLSRRPGIGFTNQFVVGETITSVNNTTNVTTTLVQDKNIPAISFRYYFNQKYGAAIAFGFDTRNDENILALGGKMFYVIFEEDFLNFYAGGSLGFIKQLETDFQGTIHLGAEFFFSGLPSLGFSAETGIRLDKTSGSFGVSTIGESFFIAGIHFYI